MVSINEIRRRGEGQLILNSDNVLYYYGEDISTWGTGILVNKNLAENILEIANQRKYVMWL